MQLALSLGSYKAEASRGGSLIDSFPFAQEKKLTADAKCLKIHDLLFSLFSFVPRIQCVFRHPTSPVLSTRQALPTNRVWEA